MAAAICDPIITRARSRGGTAETVGIDVQRRCCDPRQRVPCSGAERYAAIAQLVEHDIRNVGVTGSNPVCGTSFWPRLIDVPAGPAVALALYG